MKAVLYARVSTRGQADKGYSLRQQLDALRGYALQEGYEVLEEVQDTISGSTLERPGLNRVRDLVAAGGVSVVLAQDRDRFAREPAYLYLLREEFGEFGTKLRALNDRGDDSPEGQLTDGLIEQIAKYERAKITQRTKRGKRRKALEGKIIAHHRLPYGFECSLDRTTLVPGDTIPVVRRIFEEISRGATIIGLKKLFDSEGIPTPGGAPYWNPITIKRILQSDIYRPHTVEELRGIVPSEVLASLDSDKVYGLWYYGKNRVTERRKGRTTKDGTPRTNASAKPRRFEAVPQDEWVAVPVPLEGTGIEREWVDAARAYLKTTKSWRVNPGRRYFELRGMVYCGACGGSMTSYHNSGYYYYSCIKRRNHGGKACPNSVNMNAANLEAKVMRDVSDLLQGPERITRQLDEAIAKETATLRNPDGEAALWLRQIEDCDRKRGAYQDQQAANLMTLDELASKLRALEETKAVAEKHLAECREGQSKVESLKAAKSEMLKAFVAGIFYDGIEVFNPEMRHEIYVALGLRVSAHRVEGQKRGGRVEVDYDVGANVVRITREVEDYAAEIEEYRGKLRASRKKTDMGMVVIKWTGESCLL